MHLTDDERTMIASALTHTGPRYYSPAQVPRHLTPRGALYALWALRRAERFVGAMERSAKRRVATADLYRALLTRLTPTPRHVRG